LGYTWGKIIYHAIYGLTPCSLSPRVWTDKDAEEIEMRIFSVYAPATAAHPGDSKAHRIDFVFM
jgi:hypothetical protein